MGSEMCIRDRCVDNRLSTQMYVHFTEMLNIEEKIAHEEAYAKALANGKIIEIDDSKEIVVEAPKLLLVV